MIFEYKYYPPDTVIQDELHVSYEIKYLVFEIEFEITKYIPASFYAPEEGGELDVKRQELLYLVDSKGIEVDLTKEQKIIACDFVCYEYLDKACIEAWQVYQKEPHYE